ncbi:MAG: efflux RND transporter periplasmic adaptor subunit [Phenylobacterium sp.]|uniref:efflux RND transporter periplasmic adaptor subunit n=1 Tax=Phenylobacterium sp. TaxID=1871053 RepID=UPI001A3B5C11|nr:efflux RND transporter periplasmic adaptor subunit [Phenylobacterium sp.]MBL8772232.1 efflux RND transporter periplasmic adaptor subunit [Phenylobacterium sp.]
MKTDKTRLYGAVAAAVLVAAAGGYGVARLTAAKPPEAAAAPEKAEAAPTGLDMAADRITAAGVALQTVAAGGLASEVLAQATVTAEPTGQAVLTARAAGAVARINKRLGDPVRAGETLALVVSREAAQIAATRSSAAAKAELARKVYAREKRLFEERVSPRQDLEAAQAELAAAEAEARGAATAVSAADVSRDGRYVMVVSPISGRITASAVSLGAYVQPETELFRIADPSRIQIEASVTAADAQRVQPGDAAVIEVTGGGTREAVVRSVTPGLSAETRSATVVLALSGGNAVLQPGQTVRARITVRQTATTGIVVPDEAVQTINGSESVFVRTAKGFRVQRVSVGQRAAGRAEILSGLKPGDVVAAKNAFLLKAELQKGSEEEE